MICGLPEVDPVVISKAKYRIGICLRCNAYYFHAVGFGIGFHTQSISSLRSIRIRAVVGTDFDTLTTDFTRVGRHTIEFLALTSHCHMQKV